MDNCPYCILVKKQFANENIEYEEINVSNDEKAMKEMVKETDQYGVPVIKIGTDWIYGYDKPEIEEAIKRLKNE